MGKEVLIDFSSQQNIGLEYNHAIVEAFRKVHIFGRNLLHKKLAWPKMAKPLVLKFRY